MKLLGHPIHPMLVNFPIGLFITGVVFDLMHRFTQIEGFAFSAFYVLLLGVVSGVLAMIFGLWEWFYTKPGSRSRRVAAWHGIGNLVLTSLFAYSVYLRWLAPGYVPSAVALTLSYLAAAMLLVTAWMGGELVYRMGEAVDKGAHPNSPSSLSGKKASSR